MPITVKEFEDYVERKKLKRLSAFTRRMRKNNLDLEDLSFVDFCDDIWVEKLNMPLFTRKVNLILKCEVCGCSYKTGYRIQETRKNKNTCAHCARSANATMLNKTIIKEKRKEGFASGRLDYLKENSKIRIIERNKTIQKEYMLNLPENKKAEIANKKRNTFHDRPLKEQEAINKKRANGWYKLTEYEKEKRKEILKSYIKKYIDNISEEEKLENLKNKNHASKGEFDGIIYGSKFEKIFLLECLTNKYSISRGPNIEYFDTRTKKIRIYSIDFVVNNYLIEIKGKFFWTADLETNLCKKKAAEEYAKNNNYKEYIIFIFNNEKEINFDIIKSKIY